MMWRCVNTAFHQAPSNVIVYQLDDETKCWNVLEAELSGVNHFYPAHDKYGDELQGVRFWQALPDPPAGWPGGSEEYERTKDYDDGFYDALCLAKEQFAMYFRDLRANDEIETLNERELLNAVQEMITHRAELAALYPMPEELRPLCIHQVKIGDIYYDAAWDNPLSKEAGGDV